MQTHYLGRLHYDAALVEQDKALAKLSQNQSAAIVLGLEHEPVVTLGVRGRAEEDLVLSSSGLASQGFELRQTARGGQATLHSPGQLVIYPCTDLKAVGLGARCFVDLVQRTTRLCLLSHGVATEASATEPGLFIEGRKIVAFGFKISRGLTSHGLAINVSNDLSHFDMIRTCGVAGQKVARLHDFGPQIGLEALFLSWVPHFRSELMKAESLICKSVGSPGKIAGAQGLDASPAVPVL